MNKLTSALPLLIALAPAALHAQASTVYSSYVAADGGVDGSPTLVGAAVGAEAGWLAIRLGAAMDPRLSRPAEEFGPFGVWSAEADAMVYLRSPSAGHAWVPYAVAGMGLRSFRQDSEGPAAGMMSYGVGARVPLVWGISMEGEARYRQPLAEGEEYVPTGISSGLEARFGLSFRSARRRAVAVPAAPVPAVRPLGSPVAAPSARESGADASARLALAERALDTADDYLGVPYRWGGNTPSGFDCSGFIRYVYRQYGVELPRVSRDQARVGTPLPLDLRSLEPGDLLAFASDGSRIDHIAIYAGQGRIIHSSASGKGVRYDDLQGSRGSWYLRHWVAARRVLQSAPVFTQ